MSEEEMVVKLKQLNESAFVCRHLLLNPYLNLNFSCDIEEDREVWCDECEKILEEEGGWTKKALEFVDIQPCCGYCFAEMKNRYLEQKWPA